MMNTNNIKQLLEKYFAAETSLEEEQLLRQYFAHENIKNIDASLQKYAALFQYFNRAQQATLRKSVSQKIENQLFIPKNYNLKVIKTHKATLQNWVVKVAAVAVVALTMWWVMQPKNHPEQPQLIAQHTHHNSQDDTEENPEIAYQKAKAALLLLSGKMKKGIQTTDSKVRKVEKIGILND